MRQTCPLLAVAVLLLPLACGDAEIGSDAFRADYPLAYCAYAFRCCSAAERSYGSTSACAQAVTKDVERALAGSFDGVGAQNCLSALAGACDGILAAGCLGWASAPGGGSGDACTYATDCQSYNCLQDKAGLPGICGSVAPAGTQCSGDDRGCQSGNFCGTNRTCQPLKDAAQLCTRAGECSSGICSSATRTCAGMPTGPICDGV